MNHPHRSKLFDCSPRVAAKLAKQERALQDCRATLLALRVNLAEPYPSVVPILDTSLKMADDALNEKTDRSL